MKRVLLILLVLALCLIVGVAAFFAGNQSASFKESKGLAYSIPTLAPASSAGIPGLPQSILPSNVASSTLSYLPNLFNKNLTGYLNVDFARGSTPVVLTQNGKNYVYNCTPIIDFNLNSNASSTTANKGTLSVCIPADPQVVAYLPYMITKQIDTPVTIFTSVPAYPDYFGVLTSFATISSYTISGDYTHNDKAPTAIIQFNCESIVCSFLNSTAVRYSSSGTSYTYP
jgi:hypothetical protein